MHRSTESEALAGGQELAVYQCGHGLLHLRVHRVTLTLKPEEFGRLAALVEGLSYRMAGQALLPDERLSEWVLMQAGEQ